MRISEILTTKNLDLSSTPRLDLELLLEKVLNKPRSFLYKNPGYILDSDQYEKFQDLYWRRQRGEPIAYILGKKEFWSLEFIVNEKVLIPRPETELLIEIILARSQDPGVDLADLGTGSGVIALTLAKENPDWNIVATDISTDALQVAAHNAMRLELQNIAFYCGDWCSVLPDKKFDIIVSNPPYIEKNDQHLTRGDVSFEPNIALEAGDGMDAISKIVSQAKDRLKKGGLLVLEHGYDQKIKVMELLDKKGYKNIVPYKDLAGIDRAVVAVK